MYLSYDQVEIAEKRITDFLEERGIISDEDIYIQNSIPNSSIKSAEISKLLEESGYNSLVLIYPPSIKNKNGRKIFRQNSRGRLSQVLSKFAQMIEIKTGAIVG